jgi:hypothetical protein
VGAIIYNYAIDYEDYNSLNNQKSYLLVVHHWLHPFGLVPSSSSCFVIGTILPLYIEEFRCPPKVEFGDKYYIYRLYIYTCPPKVGYIHGLTNLDLRGTSFRVP